MKEKAELERERVDEVLYTTLRAIYHYERYLTVSFGLGYTEICLLQLLRRKPGLRIGYAARALELRLFTATRMVQRLEAEGLVRRKTDPEDRRAVRLWISAKGERVVAAIEERSFELVAANAASLSPRDLAGLAAAAEKLDELLGVSGPASEEA